MSVGVLTDTMDIVRRCLARGCNGRPVQARRSLICTDIIQRDLSAGSRSSIVDVEAWYAADRSIGCGDSVEQ